MIPILEFNELDDFIAHLREEQDTDWTHLEIGHVSGEQDAHSIRGVTFYEIATRHLLSPSEYLVVRATTLLNTTNAQLQIDKHEASEHQTHTQLHANFEKVKAMLQQRGVCVRPGRWSSQPPEYLR